MQSESRLYQEEEQLRCRCVPLSNRSQEMSATCLREHNNHIIISLNLMSIQSYTNIKIKITTCLREAVCDAREQESKRARERESEGGGGGGGGGGEL